MYLDSHILQVTAVCVQEGSMKNKKNRNKKLSFEFLLLVVILYTGTCICDLFSVEIGVLVESTV